MKALNLNSDISYEQLFKSMYLKLDKIVDILEEKKPSKKSLEEKFEEDTIDYMKNFQKLCEGRLIEIEKIRSLNNEYEKKIDDYEINKIFN